MRTVVLVDTADGKKNIAKVEAEREDAIKLIDGDMVIGNVGNFMEDEEDVLFVVYTERVRILDDDKEVDVTRLISARYATSFERGLYYGKY